MATCFEISTSSFSFLSVAGGDAARTRTEGAGEVGVDSFSFFVFGDF
jgi:hypothetical protein